MDASAPRIDCTGAMPPIGYHQFHPDVSVNFQCNRWVEWIGPSAIDEVAELAAHANTYPELIDGFLGLAEQARAADRTFAGAYYDRAAEFFMAATDPRRPAARARFLHAMRTAYDVTPDLIPFGSGSMPAYDLRPERQIGAPIVMFGGFDSYVEEFLPMIAGMVDAGRRIVVFEGPGQGSALEDFGLTMIPEWERPVAAVLDHYSLDDCCRRGDLAGRRSGDPRSRLRAADQPRGGFRHPRRLLRGDRASNRPRRPDSVARAAYRACPRGRQRYCRPGRCPQAGLTVGIAAGHARHRDCHALRLSSFDYRDEHPQNLSPGSRRRAASRRRRGPLRAAEAAGAPGGQPGQRAIGDHADLHRR